jgi:hypothetical protein
MVSIVEYHGKNLVPREQAYDIFLASAKSICVKNDEMRMEPELVRIRKES